MARDFARSLGTKDLIKSMTGFASLTHEDERATIGVTIRAVNHRFLDVQLRIPQTMSELESRVRGLLQKRLSKGRFQWWPEASGASKPLEAYEAQLLLAAGDVSRVRAAPMWRRVNAAK